MVPTVDDWENREGCGHDESENGARGGTRTPDAHLRTVALYPLSYTGRRAKAPPTNMLAQSTPGGRSLLEAGL
jgi:hypothetical protein